MATIKSPMTYQLNPDRDEDPEVNCKKLMRSLEYLMKQDNNYTILVVYPDAEACDPVEFADLMINYEKNVKILNDNPEIHEAFEKAESKSDE